MRITYTHIQIERESRHIHSKQMAKVAVEEAVKADTSFIFTLGRRLRHPKLKTKPKKSVHALLSTQGNKVNSTAMKCKNNKSCYSFCLTWPGLDRLPSRVFLVLLLLLFQLLLLLSASAAAPLLFLLLLPAPSVCSCSYHQLVGI